LAQTPDWKTKSVGGKKGRKETKKKEKRKRKEGGFSKRKTKSQSNLFRGVNATVKKGRNREKEKEMSRKNRKTQTPREGEKIRPTDCTSHSGPVWKKTTNKGNGRNIKKRAIYLGGGTEGGVAPKPTKKRLWWESWEG